MLRKKRSPLCGIDRQWQMCSHKAIMAHKAFHPLASCAYAFHVPTKVSILDSTVVTTQGELFGIAITITHFQIKPETGGWLTGVPEPGSRLPSASRSGAKRCVQDPKP